MNNIRKIIEERLENAKLDFNKTTREFNAELKGSILAYQDCLNLIPAPRTEQEILNDFEKLGYEVVINNKYEIELHQSEAKLHIMFVLYILKSAKEYQKYMVTNGKEFAYEIKYQEHKLLNELFEVWQWI